MIYDRNTTTRDPYVPMFDLGLPGLEKDESPSFVRLPSSPFNYFKDVSMLSIDFLLNLFLSIHVSSVSFNLHVCVFFSPVHHSLYPYTILHSDLLKSSSDTSLNNRCVSKQIFSFSYVIPHISFNHSGLT